MNTAVARPAAGSPAELLTMIERAARDPQVDLEKMQRLLDMHEVMVNREGEREMNAALVAASQDMQPIVADATNPQTRSKYATFAALDRQAKPIYTQHGLALSFNTEPTSTPDTIRVICYLHHTSGSTRRYQTPDLPVETTGLAGKSMMTRMHATGSAMTYGKRYLLLLIFNLAVDDDDDGNAAGGRRHVVAPINTAAGRAMNEPIDQGPAVAPAEPHALTMEQGSTWSDFVGPLTQHVMRCESAVELGEWLRLNEAMLLKLKEMKPALHKVFEANVEAKRKEFSAK
jgi:hypothetical protein